MMLIIGFAIMAIVSFHPNPETETYSLGKAHGLVHGLMAGGFFLAPCLAINYFYQQKSLKLWLIDAGYQVIFAGIIGLVVGLFYF